MRPKITAVASTGLAVGAISAMMALTVSAAHEPTAAASMQDRKGARPARSSTASPGGRDSRKQPKERCKNPLEGVDILRMRAAPDAFHQELPNGRRATFTVDPGMQRYAADLLETYEVPAGAVVLLDSRTGRVLALAERQMQGWASSKVGAALDPSPPAASLFKIVTAAALLERGAAAIDTETCYHGGSSRLVLENLVDWPREKSACVSLTAALGGSINAVFGMLADRRLDGRTLSAYAERFGFNRDLPFDVPVDPSRAEIPDDRLERARAAAGFWHTHLSPLHAAMIAQSLAQGGSMLRPYVVQRIEDANGEVLYEGRPEVVGQPVSRETAAKLVEAMVYTTTRGTARKAFRDRRGVALLPGIAVSGKTGTLNGAAPYRAYTWFAGLAPADDPKVAIAVLVVNDARWRIKAPNAAALVLKKYFDSTRAARPGRK